MLGDDRESGNKEVKPCLVLCWFRMVCELSQSTGLLQDYSALTPPISASNNL